MEDTADDVHRSFCLTDEKECSYKVVKKKFDDHFVKKKKSNLQ